jgi:hypothetical protein
MSLNIRLDINGASFGEVTVYRPEETFGASNTDEVEYRCDYKGALGVYPGLIVKHRPADGATCLAAKTLERIYDNRIRP